MLSGVSPWAICQRISPLSMSNAVMRPYGGLISGNPRTVRPPPPPPSGAAAAAVAGDGTTAGPEPPARAGGAAAPPPAPAARPVAAPRPAPAPRAAAVAAFPETRPKSLFGGAGTRPSELGV